MRAFLIAAALAAAFPVHGATLKEASGLVQVRAAGTDTWRPARPGRALSRGDSLRTGFDARAVLASEQGSVIVAAGNAHLVVEEDAKGRVLVFLLFGSARLDAAVEGGETAGLRTPVATLRARSGRASFAAAVSGGGRTVVDALDGLTGVEDERGASTLLRGGQRLEADARGLREAAARPTAERARREDFAGRMRRELGFDLARDAALDAAATETRRAEHETGRLLTDAEGRRVRVEEFVTRPAADTFRLIVLNQRPGRLDAYAWTGVFDRALPVDLGPVIASLGGSYDAAAPFTLTGYSALLTNGRDRLLERADGGHQVDLNANGDPLDDVAGGRPFFHTFFDRSGLYVNGTLKRGWSGTNVTEQSEITAAAVTAVDPFTGAALPAVLPTVDSNTTFPDAGAQARRRLESYSDGTALRRDDRALDAGGGTARAPASLTDHGAHLTVSASEWSGRTVELVGSSRILVLTRQLPW
ncbi:MAG: hypothetical protein SF051_10070 [Elusimicrobiota bacterium]|nr:hypothetical protein [Elusimicrobiota bacterium]